MQVEEEEEEDEALNNDEYDEEDFDDDDDDVPDVAPTRKWRQKPANGWFRELSFINIIIIILLDVLLAQAPLLTEKNREIMCACLCACTCAYGYVCLFVCMYVCI